MAIAATSHNAAVAGNRRRFTVDEYDRMSQAGILHEGDRVELIEGEILVMGPIGSPHAACVSRSRALFHARLRDRAIVRVRAPIRLGEHSEPEPDLALVRPKADYYAPAHPGPADIFLVIEVMDSSAEYDRRVKLPLYARFGLPEVWFIDLNQDRIEVYRRLEAGSYTDHQTRNQGQTIAPQAFPDVELGVDEILG